NPVKKKKKTGKKQNFTLYNKTKTTNLLFETETTAENHNQLKCRVVEPGLNTISTKQLLQCKVHLEITVEEGRKSQKIKEV
ncbi:hypothetical protein ACQP3D_30305, partial [Escherichia coli]